MSAVATPPGRRLGALRDVGSGIAAVGVKELRGRMRGRRAFVVLTIPLLVVAGFAWMIETITERSMSGGFSGSMSASADIGRTLFSSLIFLLTLIVLVLAPRLTAVDMAALGAVALPMIVNFGATVSVTLGTFYQKRFVPRTDLRTGTCLQFVGALAVVAPLALLTESLRFDATATLLAALAWSVLVISLAAIALLLLMLRRGEVSRVAALIYLVPPLTALEAFMLFGESLSVVQIVGMAVTALGVWLATHRR